MKKDSLVKILNIFDIVNAAKTGPESKIVDRVRYFGYLLKRIKSHKKYFYPFKKIV